MTLAKRRLFKSNLSPLACWAMVAVAVAGCQATPPKVPARTSGDVLDACAERLHDICGQLLFYYSVKGQLPERLDQLGDIGSRPLPQFICPVSGKPYTYNRDGLAMPGSSRRVLVCDAEPCHSGTRWAIVAEGADPGKPLVVHVVVLPESRLRSAEP
jgi:hypothetical protein